MKSEQPKGTDTMTFLTTNNHKNVKIYTRYILHLISSRSYRITSFLQSCLKPPKQNIQMYAEILKEPV